MDCIPPCSSVHGISQARIPEWVDISYSRESSRPEIEPASLASPALAGRFFSIVPPGEPMCQELFLGTEVKETEQTPCHHGADTVLAPLL